ncbi:MAG: 2-C-methyl-D-erythritol 4-phosphate cytidylyltransferase [Acidobacteriota bacterium]|nr:2-C-methyl-D-erythritol 4-phosphate cytidylyltransferase [Acidobacteriota bacterium]
MKVIVVIPAAGLGTRMAAAHGASKSKSKQFFELQGTPILVHTLRKFAQCAPVSEIVVALRKNETAGFQKLIAGAGFKKPIRVVEGGEHRQNSVANALASIHALDDDIVLVHDAVRPFVDQDTILGVIEAVKKYGAAIAGVPAVDTVKQVDRTADGAVVVATVPRERMVLAQTPQGFRFGLLKKAFDEATADGFMGTDEASLIERSGGEVHVVMGSPRNMKITTPADLELAEFFLSQEDRENVSLGG